MYSHISIVDKFIYLDEVESTNESILQYISKSKPQSNLCLYSFNQSKGRGQIGRNWYSGIDNNLCSSYSVHFHKLEIKAQFNLNMAVSCAIRETIQDILPNKAVKIKWPNDIYVGKEKIAGILIQNQLQSKFISSSIIGVGININESNFPTDIPNPTSIKLLEQEESLMVILLKQTEKLDKYLGKMMFSRINLEKEYLKHFYGLNEVRGFKEQSGIFTGIIKGVSSEGKLIIEKEDGLAHFNFKEIQFLH